jgi:Na+-driven multidrug efflux pump
MRDRGRQRSRWGDGVGVAGSAKTGSAVEGYTAVMSLLCFFSTATAYRRSSLKRPQCSGPRLLRIRRVGGNTVLGSSFSFSHP